MTSKRVYLTKEGLEKLKEEINYLETKERPYISKQISEARDKGDLSENAEYHAAKEAQGLLELKISKLKSKLSNVRILDKSQINTSVVSVLCKVTIKNLSNNSVMSYDLVPETEADIKNKKLAISTPIAKGLMGKKKGDIVEVEVPSGKLNFEIIDIEYDI